MATLEINGKRYPINATAPSLYQQINSAREGTTIILEVKGEVDGSLFLRPSQIGSLVVWND
jgi:hypothetical protein